MLKFQGENLYSLDEVAEAMCVTRECIRKYTIRANVSGRIVQRKKYFTEEDIRKLLSLPDRRKKSNS